MRGFSWGRFRCPTSLLLRRTSPGAEDAERSRGSSRRKRRGILFVIELLKARPARACSSITNRATGLPVEASRRGLTDNVIV
jgi:hypothetical protein